MNRNTADLYQIPLEGGGGARLGPRAWSDIVCRFAEDGDVALISSPAPDSQ